MADFILGSLVPDDSTEFGDLGSFTAHRAVAPPLRSGSRPANGRGPEVGTKLGHLSGQWLDGSDWSLEFPAPVEVALIFVSLQCQTCNELLPHVKDFARIHREVEVVLISTVDHLAMNRAYVDYQKLEWLPYVIGAKLADDLNIEGTPYALHLSREGVVMAKGLVNNYEHLVSLKEAPRVGPNGDDEVEQELVAKIGNMQ